jgi:hypothetical protein
MNLPVVRGLMKGGMVVLSGIMLEVVVVEEEEEVILAAFDSRNFEFVGMKLRNHAVRN